MRVRILILLGLLFVLVFANINTNATETDPFIIPFEEKLYSSVTAKSRCSLPLFKSLIPKPLSSLEIQGVIGTTNGYFLVVIDPETQKIFILKEGDAVSQCERLKKITYCYLIIERFTRKNGITRRTLKKINLCMEE